MMNESVNSVLQEDLINNAKIINELQSLNNKKIVVTGATGLIGSVLCKSVLCANRLYNCNITIYAVVRNMSKAQKIFENVIGRQEFNIVNYDFMGNDSFEIPDNIDYLIPGNNKNPEKYLKIINQLTHYLQQLMEQMLYLNLLERTRCQALFIYHQWRYMEVLAMRNM